MNEVVHTHARPILPQGGEEFYRAYDVEEDTRRSAYYYDQDAEFYFTHTGGEWNVYSCLVWEPDVKARLPDKARIDVPLAAGMREVEFGVLVVVVCRAPRVFFDVVGAIEFLTTLGQDGARVCVHDFVHARCTSARRWISSRARCASSSRSEAAYCATAFSRCSRADAASRACAASVPQARCVWAASSSTPPDSRRSRLVANCACASSQRGGLRLASACP